MVLTKVTRNRANRGTPREELRQRIGDAAMHLFREHGFDSVSVDQIVARAGVSKGAFFNFFPTKADALIVYFREIDARLARLRSALDPARPLAALERFFTRAEVLIRAEGTLVQTLLRAIWTHPALLAADRHSAMRDRRGFAEFLERAQALGTVDSGLDPLIAADFLGDLWTGAILKWLADDQSYRLAVSVKPKLRLLFTGLARKEKP